MVGINRAQQHRNFVRSMNEQGILDHHFGYLETLQSDDNPLYISQLLGSFFRNAEAHIEEITRYMSEARFNFVNVHDTAHQLKGASANIGGCRVALACQELLQACYNKDKEGCFTSLERVKQEYNILHENLRRFCEFERANHAADEARRCRH
ncbi:histidine phosphotransferase [Trema orientale]|uniref:Histidine-containing phosphotransfer protein n=1 Tax=Trema orientale TaxID=63057 RepID=A0A2P5BFE9_TREOI|nr:histidine phosphotransferase [Trema orientale]